MATEKRRRGDAVDVHVDTVDAVDVGAVDAVMKKKDVLRIMRS